MDMYALRHVRCIKAAPNRVADNFMYVGQSESFAEELHNMRLVIAFALFLGVLDLAYSAPHANSKALLQELRDALNEKEVQQQKKEELTAILCEPTATAVARVPTGQTQGLNEVVRAQEPVSIGLGIASLVVGLTSLGLGIADTVEGDEQSTNEGDEQSKNKAILQEIKKLLSQEKPGGNPLFANQKRSVANVPLVEMLCTPVKVEQTEKLAGGSRNLRVRTLQ